MLLTDWHYQAFGNQTSQRGPPQGPGHRTPGLRPHPAAVPVRPEGVPPQPAWRTGVAKGGHEPADDVRIVPRAVPMVSRLRLALSCLVGEQVTQGFRNRPVQTGLPYIVDTPVRLSPSHSVHWYQLIHIGKFYLLSFPAAKYSTFFKKENSAQIFQQILQKIWHAEQPVTCTMKKIGKMRHSGCFPSQFPLVSAPLVLTHIMAKQAPPPMFPISFLSWSRGGGNPACRGQCCSNRSPPGG